MRPGTSRAALDAIDGAAIAEMERRGCFITDGAVSTKTWLAHYTGITRAVAGSRVRLAKRLSRMPFLAAALAAVTSPSSTPAASADA